MTNTKTWALLSILGFIFFLLAGCAKAYVPYVPSWYDFEITSDPSGAQILVDSESVGVTPGIVSRKEGTTFTVSVKKDGYEPASAIIRPGGYTLNHPYLKKRHFTLTPEERAPLSFVKTMEPTWASVEVRDGVQYENAWNSVVDLLVRKFDMEVLSKENGYMRTGWLYSWTGEIREDYRVRVTVKFAPNRNKVDIKSEANYRTGKGWLMGSDTALLKTLKTDLMGTVGRVTR